MRARVRGLRATWATKLTIRYEQVIAALVSAVDVGLLRLYHELVLGRTLS